MTTPSIPQAIDSLISADASSADSDVISWLSPNSDASKKFKLVKRKNGTSSIWKFFHVIENASAGDGYIFLFISKNWEWFYEHMDTSDFWKCNKLQIILIHVYNPRGSFVTRVVCGLLL